MSGNIEVSLAPTELRAGQSCPLAIEFVNTGRRPCTNVIFKLQPPPEITVVGGSCRIEIPCLAPGAKHRQTLEVRADHGGTVVGFRSTNFSYRDDMGRTVRNEGFHAKLRVLDAIAASPAGAERPTVTIERRRLRPGVWGSIRGQLTNRSERSCTGLAIAVESAQGAAMVVGSQWQRAEPLGPGRTTPFDLSLRVDDRGGVPVRLHVTWVDGDGRPGECRYNVALTVEEAGDGRQPSAPAGSSGLVKNVTKIFNHYGDKVTENFQNIHGSTIITRSTVQNAFNKLSDTGLEGLRAELEELVQRVDESGNPEAQDVAQAFVEESGGARRKAVLTGLWERLKELAPVVSGFATAGTAIAKVLLGAP